MTKTLIVPGLDGSPDPHWQHWWAATVPKAPVIAPDHVKAAIDAFWAGPVE